MDVGLVRDMGRHGEPPARTGLEPFSRPFAYQHPKWRAQHRQPAWSTSEPYTSGRHHSIEKICKSWIHNMPPLKLSPTMAWSGGDQGVAMRFNSTEPAYGKPVQTIDRSRNSSCMRWHNENRPYQALDYRSPVQYRAQQVTQVA